MARSSSDKNKLQGLGLKATGPRLKILELFKNKSESGGPQHLSAEEVYRTLVENGEEIGLATVYRVLAQFVAAGILQKRTFDHGTAVFEVDDGHHHDHIICVKCGKVQEFINPEIEEIQAKIAKEMGFELCDHTMSLYGICHDCQKKSQD